MKKLTAKQEKFIQEMLKNSGNQTAAYRAAYNTKNMKESTVNKRASELMKNGEIRGRYEELLKKACTASISKGLMDVERIIEEYTNIAVSDIGDYYDMNNFDNAGNIKPRIKDLSKLDTRAIKQIKTDPRTGKVTGILMHDKMAALSKLEEIFDVKGSRSAGEGDIEIKFADAMEDMAG